MRSDLRTLLRDSAPRPRQPVDVDEVFTRVRRRRAGRVTGGVAAVLVAVALAAGLFQLVGGQPSLQIVDEVDEQPVDNLEDEQPVDEIEDGSEEAAPGSCGASGEAGSVSSLERSGAFDRGCGEPLTLDLSAQEGLRGQLLAGLDVGWPGGDFAVASDRAVGGSYDPGGYEQTGVPRMAIFIDGRIIATRAVDRSGPVAFDSYGTLWAWTGSSVAELQRDGTSVDHPVEIPPLMMPEIPEGMAQPETTARLRITGTNVSVVFSTEADRSRAHVVPVVGWDPLAGVQTVESPLPDFLDWGTEGGDILAYSSDSILTGELLLSGSVLGTARAELDWPSPPDRAREFPTSRQSQIVADTSASILHFEDLPPEHVFLVVHRAGGLAAAAIVHAPQGVWDVSVSPDGAVHLVSPPGEAAIVTSLLDAELQPHGCREPGDGDQVVDDVDLDDDGVDDRVALYPDGVIQACLAEGPVSALAAWPPRSTPDATHKLGPADLGGIDGVALTVEPNITDEPGSAYLLHLLDGGLAVVGGSGPPYVQGLRPIWEGEIWHFGSEVDQGATGSRGTFGCRPPTLPGHDFEVAQVIQYDTGLIIEAMSVDRLDLHVPNELRWELSATAETDMNRVLQDLGFTPQCAPEQ